MTPSPALTHYLKHHPKAVRDIKWLEQWDSEKTIAENVQAMGISNHAMAANFCRFYKLGFKTGYHFKANISRESLLKLRKSGLNMSEISRLLGVSPQRIEQLIKRKD